ncbi:MAG: NUDIX domain-containing protein [Halioglobus sp.]|nr:NUDIX domain-containing protein [Halioglobus sp.]
MGFQLTFGTQDVRVLKDEKVYSGYFSMRRLTLQHQRFAGGWSEPIVREVFDRGDAVAVLPYAPESDTLVMVEQFRPGAMRGEDSPWMLELIAGVVETGEVDEEVVHREAMEEAGCEIVDLVPIATVFPSAGACTEQVRLYCGRVSHAAVGGIFGLDEEGEDILVHSLSRRDTLQLLNEDRIPNGHTLIALQWLQMHGDALRKQWC